MRLEYAPPSRDLPVSLLIVGKDAVMCTSDLPRAMAWEVDAGEYADALALASPPTVADADGRAVRVNDRLLFPPSERTSRQLLARLARAEHNMTSITGSPEGNYQFNSPGGYFYVSSIPLINTTFVIVVVGEDWVWEKFDSVSFDDLALFRISPR